MSKLVVRKKVSVLRWQSEGEARMGCLPRGTTAVEGPGRLYMTDNPSGAVSDPADGPIDVAAGHILTWRQIQTGDPWSCAVYEFTMGKIEEVAS